MTAIAETEACLRTATRLPEILSASFDAFEAIRATARCRDNQAPELFAAFMMAADAAVDGREAVTAAPSLPLPASSGTDITELEADDVTVPVAGLAELLADCLTRAVNLAVIPDDRITCQHAARAARRIRDLMGAEGHDRGPG